MNCLGARRLPPALGMVLLICAVGCGPSGNAGRHAGAALLGMHRGALPLVSHALRLGMRSVRGRGGIRRVCAEDITRLCAAVEARRGVRQCLEQKRDLLGADCRSALDARRSNRAVR